MFFTFFSYLITEIFDVGMFVLIMSIPVQVSKNIIRIVNIQ